MDTNFQDSFSEEIWTSTYKDYKDQTIDDTFRRIATAIASVEVTDALKIEWADKFYDMLTGFKVVPGGRIISNAGTEWNGTTLMNCFVGPMVDYDPDSLVSIIKNLEQQAVTLKSEGGFGSSFNFTRPRGSFINGIGVESPGAVKYMELFDKSSEIITSGSGKKSNNTKAKGKIRKGALMGILSIWHPDIIEFITAKQQPGRLTKFNMSVNVSDEFMERINKTSKLDPQSDEYKELDKWDLIFPETTYEKYKAEWDGDIDKWKSKGYPFNVLNTVSANMLWNLIMESTYNRAEPGVLFLDRANKFNPFNYGETIHATNPCKIYSTIIAVADGRNGVQIGKLAEESQGKIPFLVYSGKKMKTKAGWKPEIKKAVAFKTGTKEVVEVVLSDGSSFKCTPDHKLALKTGEYVEAQHSEKFQLQEFYTFSNKNSKKSYRHINSITNGYAKQYRLLWEYLNGSYDGLTHNINHIDDDSTNDDISNLELITVEEHRKITKRHGADNPIHCCDPTYLSLYGKLNLIKGNAKKYNWSEDKLKEELAEFEKKYGKIEREDKNVYFNDEPIFVTDVIWAGEVEDVFDLTVEDNHNFFIITKTDDDKFLNCSGVLVHNCG